MSWASELTRYVELGPRDGEILRDLGPGVEPGFDGIVEDLYVRIRSHEGARCFLEGGAPQIERLKGSLRAWLAEVFEGRFDRAYWQRRTKSADTHVRIALPIP